MGVIEHGNKAVYPIIYETDYDGLGSVNCYILKQGADYTLIDAGFRAPIYQKHFLKALETHCIELKQIKRVLLTHFHSDHTGLVKWLVSELNIPVYSSRLAIPRILHDETYLAHKVDIYETIYKNYGVLHYSDQRMAKLRQTYRERETLHFKAEIHPLAEGDVVAGLKVIHTPGHSPDSISFYDVETGWLFAGDVLFETGLASALLEYDEHERIVPAYVQYFETLTKLEKMDIAVLLPGHHQPFSDVRKVMERAVNKVEYKLEKVMKHIRAGHITIEKLGLAIYGPRFGSLFTFTFSDIIGLLQLAEMRGMVVKEQVNSVWQFKVKS